MVYSPDDAHRDFLRSYALSGGQFVLATGQNPHFIVASPRIEGCRAHDWVACRDLNQHVGDAPITASSIEPASFFISTQLHHCAHQIIHARRIDRCKVRAFETYLCCQACTFQPVCWQGVADLPCGVGALAPGGAMSPRRFPLQQIEPDVPPDYLKFRAFIISVSMWRSGT